MKGILYIKLSVKSLLYDNFTNLILVGTRFQTKYDKSKKPPSPTPETKSSHLRLLCKSSVSSLPYSYTLYLFWLNKTDHSKT